MGFSYAPAVQARTGAERATLVRRTYGLVFLSIIVSMLGVAFALSQDAVMDAVAAHPFITMICAFVPLIMAQRQARVFPQNIGLTFVFTFIMGIAIAPAMRFYETNAPGAITEAAVLTLGTFGVLTLYTLVSRRDFSAWGGFFMIGLIVLLLASLLNAFIGSAAGALWISAVGVFVMAGLLVFDTWRLLRSGMLGQDDYVVAAVSIYLDLLNMFMFILSLVGGGNRRR